MALRPVTFVVGEEVDTARANASAMFNGWPANYPEVSRGLHFGRTATGEVIEYLKMTPICAPYCSALVEWVKQQPAVKLSLVLRSKGYFAYEHKSSHQLSPDHWLEVAQRLKSMDRMGVLLIDDAHSHLYAINDLIDRLAAEGNSKLKLVMNSARNHWGPRVKTPNIYQRGREFPIIKLDSREIDRLLSLVESVADLRVLVETGFAGFSQSEKRRQRMADRCHSDMFVCLKNIFRVRKI